jgi:hypothetical protein
MQKRIGNVPSHSGELAPAKKMLMQCWTRLRDTPLTLFLWQLAGFVIFMATLVDGNNAALIQKLGLVSFYLHYAIYPCIATPFVMTAAIRLGSDNSAELATHFARFLAILASGAFISSAIGVTIIHVQGVIPFPVDFLSLFNIQLSVAVTFVLDYGIFNWLYILHARRFDDRAILASFLLHRSALGRRIAQSKLLGARAQIDPEMVARILCTVQVRYRDNADMASALLDNLIDYLRLAMNRMRENNPPLATELALITSYLKLYEAETGVCVEVHANIETAEAEDRGAISLPLFVVVRKIFDASDVLPMNRPILHISALQGQMIVELENATMPFDEKDNAQLLAKLRDIADDDLITLHHSHTSGVNRHIVQIAPSNTQSTALILAEDSNQVLQ